MENEILYHAEILNSRMDINGNRYFSMIVTRNSDGLTAHGKVSGGESNCLSAMRVLTGGEWGHFRYTCVELPIREYNRVTKKFPYIGCTAEEITKSLIFA